MSNRYLKRQVAKRYIKSTARFLRFRLRKLSLSKSIKLLVSRLQIFIVELPNTGIMASASFLNFQVNSKSRDLTKIISKR